MLAQFAHSEYSRPNSAMYSDTAASPADAATCVAAWRTGAAAFIPTGDEARIDEYTTYYLTEILRKPAAHERFCHPLRAE